ncbi:MAG: MFS transporter [Acidihalobacter sp.]|uniref:MFS transporter n=1 Tax=Acidihalobacter sp. TaxID=1872108 RepID=UPI00307EDE3E
MPSTTDTPSRTWGMRLLLVLAMALPNALLYAISALGPQLVHELTITPASLGYFTMASYGTAAALSPWAGLLVNRLGVRHSLLLLFAMVALTFGLTVGLPGFYTLLLATAPLGLAQALSNPATNLLIARRVAPQRRAFVVGLKQAGISFAALFSGLVLPICALHIGWRGAFALLLLLALLALALGLAVLKRSEHPAGSVASWRAPRPNGLLALLMGTQFCVGSAIATFVTYLPAYGTDLGMAKTTAGLLLALFGVAGAVSRLLATPLSARLREEALLLGGLLLGASASVAVALHSAAHTPALLWLAAAGFGLSAVPASAIAMSMLIRDAAFGEVAVTAGMVSGTFFAGLAIGPACAGLLARFSGSLSSAWELALAMVLTATALTLLLARARSRAGSAI